MQGSEPSFCEEHTAAFSQQPSALTRQIRVIQESRAAAVLLSSSSSSSSSSSFCGHADFRRAAFPPPSSPRSSPPLAQHALAPQQQKSLADHSRSCLGLSNSDAGVGTSTPSPPFLAAAPRGVFSAILKSPASVLADISASLVVASSLPAEKVTASSSSSFTAATTTLAPTTAAGIAPTAAAVSGDGGFGGEFGVGEWKKRLQNLFGFVEEQRRRSWWGLERTPRSDSHTAAGSLTHAMDSTKAVNIKSHPHPHHLYSYPQHPSEQSKQSQQPPTQQSQQPPPQQPPYRFFSSPQQMCVALGEARNASCLPMKAEAAAEGVAEAALVTKDRSSTFEARFVNERLFSSSVLLTLRLPPPSAPCNPCCCSSSTKLLPDQLNIQDEVDSRPIWCCCCCNVGFEKAVHQYLVGLLKSHAVLRVVAEKDTTLFLSSSQSTPKKTGASRFIRAKQLQITADAEMLLHALEKKGKTKLLKTHDKTMQAPFEYSARHFFVGSKNAAEFFTPYEAMDLLFCELSEMSFAADSPCPALQGMNVLQVCCLCDIIVDLVPLHQVHLLASMRGSLEDGSLMDSKIWRFFNRKSPTSSTFRIKRSSTKSSSLGTRTVKALTGLAALEEGASFELKAAAYYGYPTASFLLFSQWLQQQQLSLLLLSTGLFLVFHCFQSPLALRILSTFAPTTTTITTAADRNTSVAFSSQIVKVITAVPTTVYAVFLHVAESDARLHALLAIALCLWLFRRLQFLSKALPVYQYVLGFSKAFYPTVKKINLLSKFPNHSFSQAETNRYLHQQQSLLFRYLQRQHHHSPLHDQPGHACTVCGLENRASPGSSSLPKSVWNNSRIDFLSVERSARSFYNNDSSFCSCSSTSATPPNSATTFNTQHLLNPTTHTITNSINTTCNIPTTTFCTQPANFIDAATNHTIHAATNCTSIYTITTTTSSSSSSSSSNSYTNRRHKHKSSDTSNKKEEDEEFVGSAADSECACISRSRLACKDRSTRQNSEERRTSPAVKKPLMKQRGFRVGETAFLRSNLTAQVRIGCPGATVVVVAAFLLYLGLFLLLLSTYRYHLVANLANDVDATSSGVTPKSGFSPEKTHTTTSLACVVGGPLKRCRRQKKLRIAPAASPTTALSVFRDEDGAGGRDYAPQAPKRTMTACASASLSSAAEEKAPAIPFPWWWRCSSERLQRAREDDTVAESQIFRSKPKESSPLLAPFFFFTACTALFTACWIFLPAAACCCSRSVLHSLLSPNSSVQAVEEVAAASSQNSRRILHCNCTLSRKVHCKQRSASSTQNITETTLPQPRPCISNFIPFSLHDSCTPTPSWCQATTTGKPTSIYSSTSSSSCRRHSGSSRAPTAPGDQLNHIESRFRSSSRTPQKSSAGAQCYNNNGCSTSACNGISSYSCGSACSKSRNNSSLNACRRSSTSSSGCGIACSDTRNNSGSGSACSGSSSSSIDCACSGSSGRAYCSSGCGCSSRSIGGDSCCGCAGLGSGSVCIDPSKEVRSVAQQQGSGVASLVGEDECAAEKAEAADEVGERLEDFSNVDAEKLERLLLSHRSPDDKTLQYFVELATLFYSAALLICVLLCSAAGSSSFFQSGVYSVFQTLRFSSSRASVFSFNPIADPNSASFLSDTALSSPLYPSTHQSLSTTAVFAATLGLFTVGIAAAAIIGATAVTTPNSAVAAATTAVVAATAVSAAVAALALAAVITGHQYYYITGGAFSDDGGNGAVFRDGCWGLGSGGYFNDGEPSDGGLVKNCGWGSVFSHAESHSCGAAGDFAGSGGGGVFSSNGGGATPRGGGESDAFSKNGGALIEGDCSSGTGADRASGADSGSGDVFIGNGKSGALSGCDDVIAGDGGGARKTLLNAGRGVHEDGAVLWSGGGVGGVFKDSFLRVLSGFLGANDLFGCLLMSVYCGALLGVVIERFFIADETSFACNHMQEQLLGTETMQGDETRQGGPEMEKTKRGDNGWGDREAERKNGEMPLFFFASSSYAFTDPCMLSARNTQNKFFTMEKSSVTGIKETVNTDENALNAEKDNVGIAEKIEKAKEKVEISETTTFPPVTEENQWSKQTATSGINTAIPTSSTNYTPVTYHGRIAFSFEKEYLRAVGLLLLLPAAAYNHVLIPCNFLSFVAVALQKSSHLKQLLHAPRLFSSSEKARVGVVDYWIGTCSKLLLLSFAAACFTCCHCFLTSTSKAHSFTQSNPVRLLPPQKQQHILQAGESQLFLLAILALQEGVVLATLLLINRMQVPAHWSELPSLVSIAEQALRCPLTTLNRKSGISEQKGAGFGQWGVITAGSEEAFEWSGKEAPTSLLLKLLEKQLLQRRLIEAQKQTSLRKSFLRLKKRVAELFKNLHLQRPLFLCRAEQFAEQPDSKIDCSGGGGHHTRSSLVVCGSFVRGSSGLTIVRELLHKEALELVRSAQWWPEMTLRVFGEGALLFEKALRTTAYFQALQRESTALKVDTNQLEAATELFLTTATKRQQLSAASLLTSKQPFSKIGLSEAPDTTPTTITSEAAPMRPYEAIHRLLGEWILNRTKSESMSPLTKHIGTPWLVRRAVENFTPRVFFDFDKETNQLSITTVLTVGLQRTMKLNLVGEEVAQSDEDAGGAWKSLTKIEDINLLKTKQENCALHVTINETRQILGNKRAKTAEDCRDDQLVYTAELHKEGLAEKVVVHRYFDRVAGPPPLLPPS